MKLIVKLTQKYRHTCWLADKHIQPRLQYRIYLHRLGNVFGAASSPRHLKQQPPRGFVRDKEFSSSPVGRQADRWKDEQTNRPARTDLQASGRTPGRRTPGGRTPGGLKTNLRNNCPQQVIIRAKR